MKNILFVPMRTDALYLSEDTMLADATADFSHLPYFNGSRDVNADVANISESVASQPLADQNLRLRKGLHLHWALPDAMNRGRHRDGETKFPTVPNRWLVTRKIGSEEKSWVVESDYLFPEDKELANPPAGKEAEYEKLKKARRLSITVPFEIDGRESGEQPFRYMGRIVEADQYDPKDGADRYPNLTMVGYGEPSFAAYYPNCRNVFGFHDPEIGENSGPVTYEIIGWYSDGKQDFLKQLTDQMPEILFEDFHRNFPELNAKEAEDLWIQLLENHVLNDKNAKQSPAERAFVRPSFEWEPSLPSEDNFQLAMDYLEGLLAQHIQEQAGWVFENVVSKDQWNNFLKGEVSTDLWDQFVAKGWLRPLQDNPDFAVIPPMSERTFESLKKLFPSAWESYVFYLKTLLHYQLSARQTLLHSSIEINTSGHDGKLPKEEAKDISFALGNTGTEALSAYLALRLEGTGFGEAEKIEEQLEALYLLDRLDQRQLDLDAKFEEARHDNGFRAFTSGHLWTTSIKSESNEAANAVKESDKPKLPAEIGDLLNKTNALQAEYDHSQAELKSLGTQLFADWYKYMVSTYPPEDTRTDYPDIDEVRYFIEEQVMVPLREKEAETGTLDLAKPEEITSGKNLASGKGGNTDATAKKLARSINALVQKLNEANAALPTGSASFELKRVGGPRYYQPAEPVVLLVNDEAGNSILQPTRRHGQDGRQRTDGLLAVHIMTVDEKATALLDNPDILKKLWTTIQLLTADGSIGQTVWDGQPWNPFRLEWELEMVPLGKGVNIEEGDYDPDFLMKKYGFESEDGTDEIHQYFRLPVNSPDLIADHRTAAKFKSLSNPNIYIGKSLLTPQAKRNLYSRLEIFLSENLSEDDYKKIQADSVFAQQKINELGGAVSPVATAIQAFLLLKNDDLHLLSQAFSGFNESLVQLRQTLQMPIADPIGFLDYQPLTEEVARLAKHSRLLAPQPLTDFNPIRNGKLIINQLRLVDTFGQVRDIDLGKLDRVMGAGTSPTPTKNEDSKIDVPLQPRLAQPARLNFRWLSAAEGEVEMNAAPSTSPVCGWLLTNQLDDSLVVYDANGLMLGSIEAEDGPDGLARWNTAPGALHPVLPEAISNVFLKKMVEKIRTGGAVHVAQFIDGMDAALRGIEPESGEGQQALSLLVGRPVALVRASLDLQLMGMPAVDQGWKSFYDDREDGDFERKKDRFPEVKFPVRIGEFSQFNDGLVGYWKETGGALSEEFFLNQVPLANITDQRIRMLDDDEISIFQSISSPAQLVSMLIDPRGKVHVTTGILPVKEIDIPAEQYLPAMQRMGVTFLTSPLLSPAANVQSLLPTEEGFQWSWVEKRADAWREVFPFPTIERGVFGQAFVDKILAKLTEKKWVRHFWEDQFLFLDEDSHLPLDGQLQPADTDLFGILDEISFEQTIEDGSVELRFSKKKFHQKIMVENDLGGKVWDRLVRSDVRWAEFIPDRPDTFVILPQAERSSQDLAGLGMEFLVEEILQAHSQVLREPRMDAHFADGRMTLREGYLKLEVAKP